MPPKRRGEFPDRGRHLRRLRPDHRRRLLERVEARDVVVGLGQKLEHAEPFQDLGHMRADADQEHLLAMPLAAPKLNGPLKW